MIIKCPDCGLEYSYGRNICHMCEDNTILFGAIFKEPGKAYRWNYRTNFSYLERSLKKSNPSRDPINDIKDEKGVKIAEILF